MSEDTVREILLRAKKNLGDSWGRIYRGEADYSQEWEEAQSAAVARAIQQAREQMVDLDEATVKLFEKYRISELQESLKSAILFCRQPPLQAQPEPELSSEETKELKKRLQKFFQELESYRPEDRLSKEQIDQLRERSDRAWMQMRPQLDLDLDLQRRAHQRWEKHLKALEAQSSCEELRPLAPAAITRKDLPQGSKRWNTPGKHEGFYYELYQTGHLKRLAYFRNDELIEEIQLEQKAAEARWEDGANVAEFHADRRVEEYGGRYDRDSRWNSGFRDWVLDRIAQMGKY